MKAKGTLVWGIALIAMGLVGASVLAVSLGGFGPEADSSLPGQRIYYTGSDANGPIPRTVAGAGMMGFGGMGDVACVDCHGEDGRGGRIGMMFGFVGISDIRYSVLSSARSEDGTTVPAWSDDDIARAIRDGVEPDGRSMEAPMPRWDMTDAQVKEVIDYLKELDRR